MFSKICFRLSKVVQVGLADMLISVHNCRCGNRRISMILTTKSKIGRCMDFGTFQDPTFMRGGGWDTRATNC